MAAGFSPTPIYRARAATTAPDQIRNPPGTAGDVGVNLDITPWLMMNVCGPINSNPDRLFPVVFGCTVYVNEPEDGPLPLNEIHACDVVAAHGQPLPVLTVIVPVPPRRRSSCSRAQRVATGVRRLRDGDDASGNAQGG